MGLRDLSGIGSLAPVLDGLKSVLESIHAHLEIQTRELIMLRHAQRSTKELTHQEVSSIIEAHLEELR